VPVGGKDGLGVRMEYSSRVVREKDSLAEILAEFKNYFSLRWMLSFI